VSAATGHASALEKELAGGGAGQGLVRWPARALGDSRA